MDIIKKKKNNRAFFCIVNFRRHTWTNRGHSSHGIQPYAIKIYFKPIYSDFALNFASGRGREHKYMYCLSQYWEANVGTRYLYKER